MPCLPGRGQDQVRKDEMGQLLGPTTGTVGWLAGGSQRGAPKEGPRWKLCHRQLLGQNIPYALTGHPLNLE